MPGTPPLRRPVRLPRALATAAAVALTAAALLPPAPANAAPDAPATPVSTAAAPTATSYDRTIRRARAAANAALRETGASSISLALVAGQDVVWRQTFGTVDDAGTRPGPRTRYGIGSVTKVLTAVAVMQLVDRGLVDLDAPVVSYLPEFTMADPAHRQITVRMLLNHSAGLPGSDYANGITAVPFPGYPDQVLATLRTQRLKTSPGSMSVYCNDCFTLAGLVVERVSGKPLTTAMRDGIFTPLGMSDTAFPGAAFPAGSWAPVLGDDGPRPREILNLDATGAVWSTPTDLSRLAEMLLADGRFQGRRILSAASVAEMGTLQVGTTLTPVVEQGWQYGLGWDTVAEPGLAAVGVTAWRKGGDTTDYHASFVVAPEADLAVTVLGAGRTFSSNAAQDLAQEVLLDSLVDQGTIAAVPAAVGDTTKARRSPSRGQLRAITGTYLAQGGTVRVTARDDRTLRVALLEGDDWTALPGRFSLRTDGAFWDGPRSIRVARAWGNTYLVRRGTDGHGHYRVDSILGQRVGPAGATSPAWRARIGRWLMVNERPDSTGWATAGGELREIPGLPGYLVLEQGAIPLDVGGSDTVATMFLRIPGIMGRDLDDISVVSHEGEEWLRYGTYLLRPASGVPALQPGETAVPIGAEGYATWRRVPAAGRLQVRGASDWKLYAPDWAPVASGQGDTAAVAAEAGGHLVVFGPPSTTVTVTLG